MKKRVLIIKQLWNPEPTAKSLDFARKLVQNGFEVEVLTGYPNYPIGKIYDGYKQELWTIEYMEDIRVVRVPIYPQHSSKAFQRILGYISFALSASLVGPFICKKPMLVFAYQGAITVGIPAQIFKLLYNVPYVYDINDLWPESVSASGMLKSGLAISFLRKWSKFNLKRAKHITVATDGFKSAIQTLGISEDKISVISNWSRDEFSNNTLDLDEKEDIMKEEYFNILYAGNLGIVQSLYSILDGMKMLQENSTNIALIFLGDGAEKKRLISYTEDNNIQNIKFLPRVSSEDVSRYLNSADALLVHLKKHELFEITIPSKILSYLRTSKPILCGLKGNSAELVQNARAGVCFEPDNSRDFYNVVLEMAQKLQFTNSESFSGGREFYEKNLSINIATEKFVLIFNKIMHDQE